MRKKTIVITGCSSGFGRCSAFTLATQGWHVFATVRKEEDRASLLSEAEARQCQDNLTVLLCDITQKEQVVALAREVQERLRNVHIDDPDNIPLAQITAVPTLDALLNNAGTAYGAPVEILPLEDLRAQFEINVVAHVAVTQAFLPLLKAARGTIINVSSISGRISTPMMGAYAASKHALEGLTEALRMELAPFGVRVVLIEPASSPTSIWETSLQRAMGHLGTQVEQSDYTRLFHSTIKGVKRSSKIGFPPQRFADLVTYILSTPKPRARYGVPGSATFLIQLRRFLPDSWWDRLIRSTVHW